MPKRLAKWKTAGTVGIPTATFDIEGLSTLEARLRAVAEQVGGNPLRTAVRSGMAKPVRDTARMLAPKKTGKLARAIEYRIVGTRQRDFATKRGNSYEGYNIGVLMDAEYFRGESGPGAANYWYFVEYGTDGAEAGSVKSSRVPKAKVLANKDGIVYGTRARGQPARPFLRPAINNQPQKLLNNFTSEFDRVLTAAEKRAKRINLKD